MLPCRISLHVMPFAGWTLLVVAAGLPLRSEEPDDAPKTKEVKAQALTLAVPVEWKSKPATQFRIAQFDIPAAEGDERGAEFVVFHFQGGAGTVDANITRWIGQFQEKGRKAKAWEGETKDGKYVLVDLTGTWNMPVGPPVAMKTEPLPGARMLAVMLQAGKESYFLRLAGPEKTVTEAEEAFRKAFGADKEKEKERKIKD